jgi:hypothetical protein
MAKPVTSGARLELAFELERVGKAPSQTLSSPPARCGFTDKLASAFTRHRGSGKPRPARLRASVDGFAQGLGRCRGCHAMRLPNDWR